MTLNGPFPSETRSRKIVLRLSCQYTNQSPPVVTSEKNCDIKLSHSDTQSCRDVGVHSKSRSHSRYKTGENSSGGLVPTATQRLSHDRQAKVLRGARILLFSRHQGLFLSRLFLQGFYWSRSLSRWAGFLRPTVRRSVLRITQVDSNCTEFMPAKFR